MVEIRHIELQLVAFPTGDFPQAGFTRRESTMSFSTLVYQDCRHNEHEPSPLGGNMVWRATQFRKESKMEPNSRYATSDGTVSRSNHDATKMVIAESSMIKIPTLDGEYFDNPSLMVKYNSNYGFDK